jgi:hypothetical protein
MAIVYDKNGYAFEIGLNYEEKSIVLTGTTRDGLQISFSFDTDISISLSKYIEIGVDMLNTPLTIEQRVKMLEDRLKGLK